MLKHAYFVKGMHCAACEMLIEKELLAMENVKMAEADLARGAVDIEYVGSRPSIGHLNKLFFGQGYIFSDSPFEKERSNFMKPVVAAILGALAFLVITKLGLASLVNINSNASSGAFFVFGVLAGLSSCAALIGGLILSLAKRWSEIYGAKSGLGDKIKPHLLFNFGRLVSFPLLGGFLGFLGEKMKISPMVISIFVILVSALMFVLALQMLGVRAFNRFRLALPKNLTGEILRGEKKGSRFYPFLIGFLTVLLPCGFTLIAESAAILSGRAWQGFLIMSFFVVGTSLPLLGIGLSGAKLAESRKFSDVFLKAAGLLVIFFIFYNLNFQFGFTRYLFNAERPGAVSSDEPLNTSSSDQVANADVQVIKAVYTEFGDISPSAFEVAVNKPVRFEVEAKDTGYGCMSTILVQGLFKKPQPLVKGRTVVMEFTPKKTGTYQIICAMGVPRGTIKAK